MTQIDDIDRDLSDRDRCRRKDPKHHPQLPRLSGGLPPRRSPTGLPRHARELLVERVYGFLGDLKQRGASPAYQHRRHREVKTFFSWCRRMKYVDDNVIAKVALVKLDQKIHPPFSPDDIRLLLNSLDRSRLPGCRNHALVLFLLDTGVRVSE